MAQHCGAPTVLVNCSMFAHPSHHHQRPSLNKNPLYLSYLTDLGKIPDLWSTFRSLKNLSVQRWWKSQDVAATISRCLRRHDAGDHFDRWCSGRGMSLPDHNDSNLRRLSHNRNFKLKDKWILKPFIIIYNVPVHTEKVISIFLMVKRYYRDLLPLYSPILTPIEECITVIKHNICIEFSTTLRHHLWSTLYAPVGAKTVWHCSLIWFPLQGVYQTVTLVLIAALEGHVKSKYSAILVF